MPHTTSKQANQNTDTLTQRDSGVVTHQNSNQKNKSAKHRSVSWCWTVRNTWKLMSGFQGGEQVPSVCSLQSEGEPQSVRAKLPPPSVGRAPCPPVSRERNVGHLRLLGTLAEPRMRLPW